MRKLAIFSLSLLGLFDSLYLLWVYTSPSRPLVCLGTGCDAVRASVYAHARGLPVPLYGVAMYAALALLVFIEPWLGRLSRLLIAALAGFGFMASLYLTGLEAFVIHAFCAWCVVSAFAITAILILSLWELRSPAGLRPGAVAAAASPRLARLSAMLPAQMIVVFVAALLVGIPSFRYLSHHGEIAPPPKASAEVLAAHLVRTDSHTIGNPQAPVTVVEFGDFECAACGRAQPTVEAIRKKYGDQVRFVFRQFPLESIHPRAEKAAEASECAAEQGKFWEMADQLYAHQGDLSEAALVAYAGTLGLDKARFKQCVATGSTSDRIRRDIADGHALGLRGTPTFVIGEHTVYGPMNFKEFAQVIDQQLAGSGAPGAQLASHSPGTGSGRGVGLPGQESGTAAAQTSSSSPGAASANPPPLSSNGSSNSSTGLLGSGNAFAQLGGESGLACSEDEAARKQPELIRTEEARRLFESPSKTFFVDVRSAAEYGSAHIRGAVNIPVDEMEKRWNTLPRDKVVVFYESGKGRGDDDICAAGRAAGRVLLKRGFNFEQIKVYQDGLLGWQAAKLPVNR